MESYFEQIRPFRDEEMGGAIRRIVDNELFSTIVKYIYPDQDVKAYKDKLLNVDSVDGFQKVVMKDVIETLVNRSSEGLSESGFSNLFSDKNYMFIANHRDIFLDAAILQLVLVKYGLKSAQIGFGNNLLKNDFIVDFVKLNKMFCVIRGLKGHAAYRNMQQLSAYLQYVLLEEHDSVWIAQQSGRTKNGKDQTNTAILKMFMLNGNSTFLQCFSAMNVTPIAISYEYEPCDFLKTQEVYLQTQGAYTKRLDEDMQSVLNGIMQPKGHIHLAASPTLTMEELEECNQLREKECFIKLAEIIDEHIHRSYKLWSNNYVAYDLLHHTSQYESHYTQEEKFHFENYMQKGLAALSGDPEELRIIFLKIYASCLD